MSTPYIPEHIKWKESALRFDGTVDLLVIGGGINGVGIARDAAGLADRYAHAYGTRAVALLGDARRASDLGHDFGAGLHEREVAYLAENEWAETADDILWRRSKLGLQVNGGTAAALDGWLAGAPGGRRVRAL